MPVTVNGIGTMYYGRSSVVSRPDTCEHCNRAATLTSYDTRLWFTIVFVPVIPLGRLRIMDECSACRRHRVMKLNQWMQAREQALRESAEAHRRKPSDPPAAREAVAAAVLFHDEQALASAAESIDRHLEANAEIQLTLGQAWMHFSRFEQAADAFRASLLAGDSEEAREWLAYALNALSRPDEALPWLEHVLKRGEQRAVGLLYGVVGGYQRQQRHDRALQVLEQIGVSFPEIARGRDHQRLVRSVMEGKPARLPSLQSLNDPEAPSRRRRRLWIGAGVVAALLVLGYFGVALLQGSMREVHIVNGTGASYTALVGGRAVTLAPYASQAVRLAEGDIPVEVHGTMLANGTQTCRIATPLITRPFTFKRKYVINPDRTALLLCEQVGYGRRASVADYAYSLHAGDLLYEFTDIDFAFRGFPSQVSTYATTVVRRRIDHEIERDPRDRIQTLDDAFGRERATAIMQNLALFEPENRRVAETLYNRLDDAQILAFIEPMRRQRPVLVEWHRHYQHSMTRLGREADLKPEYDAMLAEQPDDPARRYLAGRLLNDQRERERLYLTLVSDDPQLEPATHWLFYATMSTGRFEEALELARRMVRLNPGDMHSYSHEIEALLALGQIDEALLRNALERGNRRFAGHIASDHMLLLMRQARHDEAEQVASAFLNMVARDSPSLEVWQSWLGALAAYQRGDERAYGEYAIGVHESPYRRMEGFLTLGRPAEALEICRLVSEEIEARNWLEVAIVAAMSNDQPLEDAAIAEATAMLQKRSSDERMILPWLSGDLPANPEDILQYRARTGEKLALLVFVGLRETDPSRRAKYFDLAQRLNFDTRFPHLLMKRAMRRSEGGVKPADQPPCAPPKSRCMRGMSSRRQKMYTWSELWSVVLPRGAMSSWPRTTRIAAAPCGNGIFESGTLHTASVSSMWYDRISPLSSCIELISSTAAGGGGSSASSPSVRVNHRSVEPGTNALTTTTKNTTLNTSKAPGALARIGIVARMIGTAAQADPADVRDLAHAVAQRRQAQRHRQRAGDHGQEQRHRHAHARDAPQLRWKHQQAEDEEHRDLPQPRHGVVNPPQAIAVGDRAVADDDRSDVHRKEAAAVDQRRDAERQQRQPEGEHRVQSARAEAQSAEHDHAQRSQRDADQAAHDQLQRHQPQQPPAQRLTGDDHLRDGGGEHDRHGVVEARFEFERRAHAFFEVEPAAAQDGEDGGGVCGRDDRAQQHRRRPGESQQPRPEGHEPGGGDHPHGCEDRRRYDHAAHALPRRVHAAIEEDEHQRDGAEAEGELVVVEGEPADAFRAREHPQHQEQQHDRHAETIESAAEDHAHRHQQAEGGQENSGWQRLGGHLDSGRNAPTAYTRRATVEHAAAAAAPAPPRPDMPCAVNCPRGPPA